MKINKSIIKELTGYLNEFNLTEIEYTDKDTKIKVSKSNPTSSSQVVSVAVPTSAEEKPKTISGNEVKSPIIGTAYHSPEPGAKKFSEIGKRIKKGETVMIVEAMKTMNHVPSTADGIIKEICVEDGQPVEYGQTIIIVE
jgi:acetyl-CoA carboxylase biotin carboxyl carrier protein